MREDDPFAKPEPKPLRLDEQSIEDLEAMIEDLRERIRTCEDLIAKKRASRLAADSVFGRRS